MIKQNAIIKGVFFILRIYDDETGKIYTRKDIINGNDLKDARNTNSDNCGNIYNVGCMLYDYTPKTLNEIIKEDK